MHTNNMGFVKTAGMLAGALKSSDIASGAGGNLPLMPGGTSGPTTISPTFQQSFTPQVSPVFQQLQESPGATLSAQPIQQATGGQYAEGGSSRSPTSPPGLPSTNYPSLPRAALPSRALGFPAFPPEPSILQQQMGADWKIPALIAGAAIVGMGLFMGKRGGRRAFRRR